MTVKVVGVGTLDSYRIWVRFDDGVSGELDLAHLAELPMYQPWHDPAVFATVPGRPIRALCDLVHAAGRC